MPLLSLVFALMKTRTQNVGYPAPLCSSGYWILLVSINPMDIWIWKLITRPIRRCINQLTLLLQYDKLQVQDVLKYIFFRESTPHSLRTLSTAFFFIPLYSSPTRIRCIWYSCHAGEARSNANEYRRVKDFFIRKRGVENGNLWRNMSWKAPLVGFRYCPGGGKRRRRPHPGVATSVVGLTWLNKYPLLQYWVYGINQL